MKVIIATLTLTIITSATSYTASAAYTDNKPSSNQKIITRLKDDGGKDTATIKKKDDKSFKETMRFLLLKFEK